MRGLGAIKLRLKYKKNAKKTKQAIGIIYVQAGDGLFIHMRTSSSPQFGTVAIIANMRSNTPKARLNLPTVLRPSIFRNVFIALNACCNNLFIFG